MIRVTLRYGTNRLPDTPVESNTTVASVKEMFGAALGLPESTQSLVNNDPVADTHVLQDTDNVSFEKQACRKA